MKNSNNFTTSKIWNDSIKIRYPLDKIIKIDDLYFYIDNKVLKCLQFFEFDISKSTYDKMSDYIEKGYTIKFSYLNDQTLFKSLTKWNKNKGFQMKIVDEWFAPQLELNKSINVIDYLKNSIYSQIKRNYKKFQKEKRNYNFELADNSNIHQLWNDVLYIDNNSWKGIKQCDMKSLDREDLQYIFYLLEQHNNSSLLVTYKDDEALAYSLMFRASEKEMWYAVKWGASSKGRKEYAGVYCLFEHLGILYKENSILKLDFWGRRSQTYDYLKNKVIKRYHIEICK